MMKTPPSVTPGDDIAVLAPSSQIPIVAVERATDRLQQLYDLSPTLYPSVTSESRLPPEKRAEEVHSAFESDYTAIFAVTGGYDQMSLLKYIEPKRLRANPTRFFGISDNTHLHAALSEAGVVSYYGCQFIPGLSWGPSLPEYTERYLRKALFEESIGQIEPSKRWTEDHYRMGDNDTREWQENHGWKWEFPTDEPVTGQTWGGCFIILEHILAIDRFVPNPSDLDPYVLIVESSGLVPDPYYIESVLRCLGERQLLDSAVAVVVGRPKSRTDGPDGTRVDTNYRSKQRKTIRDVCREYATDIPLLFGFDFGHTNPQVPIPIGGQIQLDPEHSSVRFTG